MITITNSVVTITESFVRLSPSILQIWCLDIHNIIIIFISDALVGYCIRWLLVVETFWLVHDVKLYNLKWSQNFQTIDYLTNDSQPSFVFWIIFMFFYNGPGEVSILWSFWMNVTFDPCQILGKIREAIKTKKQKKVWILFGYFFYGFP